MFKFKKAEIEVKSDNYMRDLHVKVLRDNVETWKLHLAEDSMDDAETKASLMSISYEVALVLESLDRIDREFSKKLKMKNEERLTEILKFKYNNRQVKKLMK